jgi:membrane fusion protein (multidrug efflux system)
MKKQALIATVATVIGIGSASALYASYTRSHISTDDAQITGHLDPITSRIAGPVARVLIKDNQVVHAGDVLIEIDSRLFQSTYDKDQAALARDMAQLKVLSATIERDRANSDLAKRESRRTLNLSKKAFATASRLDKDMSAYQMAQAQTKADTETMKVLKETIHRDEAVLAIDSINLRYTKVLAPVDGRITGKTIELGTYLTPGQIVDMSFPSTCGLSPTTRKQIFMAFGRVTPSPSRSMPFPDRPFMDTSTVSPNRLGLFYLFCLRKMPPATSQR